MTADIAVINVQSGQAPVIVTCDVVIGGIIQINGVVLRRGRGMATYVNLPRQCRDGQWLPAVTITAPDLLSLVRQAVIASALEATRYIVP